MPTILYRGATPPGGRVRRPTRLVMFGVLLICVGAICGFLALMLPMASQLTAQQPSSARGFRGSPPPARVDPKAFLPPMLFLGAMATVLIWTGIGSIMMRRWSRPIAMSLAGIFLYGSLVTLAQLGVQWLMDPMYGVNLNATSARVAARMPQPQAFTSAVASISYYAGYFLAGIFFPAMILFGFGSRETRAILDEADPTPGWTDRCPVPVFALSAALVYLAFLTLLFLPMGRAPFFGQVLEDMLAAGELIVIAALLVGVALLIYWMNPVGPWLAIALVVAIAVSVVMTARETALADPFKQRDLGAFSSVQTMQLASTRGIVSIGVLILPAICYILYVRRRIDSRPLSQPTQP
jgi:hypothetical protein